MPACSSCTGDVAEPSLQQQSVRREQRRFPGVRSARMKGATTSEAAEVDRVDARDAARAIPQQVARRPLRRAVAARQYKAREHKEGCHRQVAAAQDRVHRRRHGERGRLEHLAAAGQVVQDDPERQDEAQPGQRGQMSRCAASLRLVEPRDGAGGILDDAEPARAGMRRSATRTFPPRSGQRRTLSSSRRL